MCIRFDEIDGFIKTHVRIRYLVLFDYEWFDKIFNRIKYLISEKIDITDRVFIIILQESELIHIIP